MNIAAADIGATNVGLCTHDGKEFRVSSWHPKEAGPGDAIDYEAEGRRLGEWRGYWWSFLTGEKIERLAVETPLQSNMQRRVKIDGKQMFGGFASVGATSMKSVFRIYNMTGAAIEIAVRLNIPVTMVPGAAWKMSFIGVAKAPKGTKDGRAWLKARTRQEAERIGVVCRNNDQGDAVGILWHFRAKLKLDGLGSKPGDLLSVLAQ